MTVDDIDDTRRESGLRNVPGQDQHGQRSLLSELEHHCVTAAECRSQLPARHAQWVVPRDDLSTDAQRLFQRVGKLLRANVDNLTEVLVREASIVPQHVGDLFDILVECCSVRLSIVNGLDRRQGIGVFID